MQIQILNGIYTDAEPDFRTAYPVNYVPVPKKQGVSNGYLRPADGLVATGHTGPGLDRGGINWRGRHYRVMGTKLVEIDATGAAVILGDVGGDGLVSMDYSFDRLAVASAGKLFYWDGSTLRRVNDPDLGTVLDLIWVDDYLMTTDGEFLVVTELSDPFTVLPTKYGSSEADPDPIKALIKLRNEPHALNRYTIEAFDNIGGTGFPFTRIDGAQIQRGVIGTRACCQFQESIAFVGGGRNEPPAVWLAANGSSIPISTREIDIILQGYSEQTLSGILVESHINEKHAHLYVHLPDQTLAYDAVASQVLGEPVWFILSSGLEAIEQYRAQNLVWVYDKWWVGDTVIPQVGYIDDSVSDHWGDAVGWEFSTPIVYNESNGAIFHELELVALSGRVTLGTDPQIYTQYSLDGETWSMPRFISAGKIGERGKRLVWLGQGPMRHWRIQRFRGNSNAQLSVARLEARVEPLMV